jgi:dienelactone hydrolase
MINVSRDFRWVGGGLIALLLASGAAQSDDLARRYENPGPHGVTITTGTWTDTSRQRDVPWKLYLPDATGAPMPVVVWSHGLGGSRDGAEYLGRHIASHGFATFHIQHAGSDVAVARRGRTALFGAVQNPDVSLQRFLDVPFAVARIREMQHDGPVAGRFDATRIGMSGHSYGAITTLVAAGQRFGPITLDMPTFAGGFAMSPSPPRNAPADRAYARMTAPIFHLTGTEDGSPLGDLKPIDRRIPFDTINGVDQYLLILERGVHMTFSGRRDQDYPEIERHHAIVRTAAIAFWHTVLNDDAEARAWLQRGGFGAYVGGDATFEFKPAD